MRITPANGAFGVEVSELQLATASDQDMARLRELFLEHGVLFMRDQEMTPEQHIAFAERWGSININRFFKAVDGQPQIAEVRKEPHEKVNIGGDWHTDHSYDLVPAMGSILRAVELPPQGGDTLFASMGLAYDGLSEDDKALFGSLQAHHSSVHVFGEGSFYDDDALGGRIGQKDKANQDVVHDVVLAHPDTGRKGIYVNPGFTVKLLGMPEEESRAQLKRLYEHCIKDEFVTRFVWREGSIAMWDNRATWHNALNDYHGERRLMHRITLEGSPLTHSTTLHEFTNKTTDQSAAASA